MMDFSNMQLQHWLLIGGGALVVLALLAFFTMGRKGKIPAIMICALLGIGIGGGAGMFAFAYYGSEIYDPQKHVEADDSQLGAPGGGGDTPPGGGGPGGGGPGGPGGGPGGGGPGGRPGGGGPGGRPGGGGFQISSKLQLVRLIETLDLVSGKKLTLQLTDEQKKVVVEQLKGLDGEKLTEDEAKKRLDALVKSLESHKDVLTSAGYRWPGSRPGGGRPGGRPGAEEANPFAEGDPASHLKALKERVGAK